jgi:serine/threonine-protein kinase RsbW
VINDEGRGFDPKEVANPLRNENLLRESGRGIFLMRTLMDRVEFESIRGGYEVRLWLALNK